MLWSRLLDPKVFAERNAIVMFVISRQCWYSIVSSATWTRTGAFSIRVLVWYTCGLSGASWISVYVFLRYLNIISYAWNWRNAIFTFKECNWHDRSPRCRQMTATFRLASGYSLFSPFLTPSYKHVLYPCQQGFCFAWRSQNLLLTISYRTGLCH